MLYIQFKIVCSNRYCFPAFHQFLPDFIQALHPFGRIVCKAYPVYICFFKNWQVACCREMCTFADEAVQSAFHKGKIHRGILKVSCAQHPCVLCFQQIRMGTLTVLSRNRSHFQYMVIVDDTRLSPPVPDFPG